LRQLIAQARIEDFDVEFFSFVHEQAKLVIMIRGLN
jgi:hypothetical protein